MLKEFFCKSCFQTKRQDMKSKSGGYCTACEQSIISNAVKDSLKDINPIIKVKPHTVKHKEDMDDLEYSRVLSGIEDYHSNKWMEL